MNMSENWQARYMQYNMDIIYLLLLLLLVY